MPNIGQLTYSVFPPQADPGMLADNEVNHIESFPAIEVIAPGRGVEMASDGVSVQQPQQTGSTLAIIGFSILQTARPGAGSANVTTLYGVGGSSYQPGDIVPVLRKGALFAEWSGTTQTAYGTPNMFHSSTTATNRGKVTDTATATTAGSEVAACPHWVQLRGALPGTGNIALINVSSPGAA